MKMAYSRNLFSFKISNYLVLVVFCYSLLLLGYAQAYSGDGPVGFGSVIEDQEPVSGSVHIESGVSSSTHANQKEEEDIWLDDDDEDDEVVDAAGSIFSKSSSSTHAPVEVVTETNTGKTDAETPAFSASSGSIIITVVVITLVILFCCAWRVILVRKKRAAKQRRSLRNHAVTANLLQNEKPYKELTEIRRPDVNLNIEGEKTSMATRELPPLPTSTVPTTFQTTVAVEDHEALSKRLSPPPTYEEYLRQSREDLDVNLDKRLSDLGPTYR